MPQSFSTPVVVSAVLAIFIICIHIYVAVADGLLSRILSYINIALHIALVPLLLFSGAELVFLVLVFMLSTLVYSFCQYAAYRHKEKARDGEEEV